MRKMVFIPSTKMDPPAAEIPMRRGEGMSAPYLDTITAADIPVARIEELTGLKLEEVAFFLLDCSDWRDGYRKLCRVRRTVNPMLYLKPIIFINGLEDIPDDILRAADGWIQDMDRDINKQLEGWVSKLEATNQRIQQLAGATTDNDTNISFKVLRYIASRNITMSPTTSVRTINGYVYPALQPFFPKSDVGIFEVLEYLQMQKMLSGEFISNAYSCTHCGCAFLNFYENCPDCDSHDLSTDELIHHFRCAYVGELKEFRREDKLICPKCDKMLKQIGVDYDKASVIYHCNQCGNIFQEPGIMTSCYNCHRETRPENQIQRTIQAYAITAIGKNAAQYGLDSLFQNIIESTLPTIPFEAFKQFFRIEQARISRYKLSTSSFAIFKLDGMERLYTLLGRRTHEVFTEISESFREGLRSSDIFCLRNETLFLIILTETTSENSSIALNRIRERIATLLNNNIGVNIDIGISIEPLSAALDLDLCLEKVLDEAPACQLPRKT